MRFVIVRSTLVDSPIRDDSREVQAESIEGAKRIATRLLQTVGDEVQVYNVDPRTGGKAGFPVARRRTGERWRNIAGTPGHYWWR